MPGAAEVLGTDDYAELIAELGLGTVRVAGISMGGAIAQELALRHPSLVSKLVLVSSWARLDTYSAEIFQNLAAMREQAAPVTFAQLLQLWIWNPGWFDEHAEELIAARGSAGPGMAPHAFAAQVAACVSHDTLERLCSISVPTLVTVGSRDVFTPPRFARALADGIPGARLEIFEGLAHTHHWEALDDFNGLVQEWLR